MAGQGRATGERAAKGFARPTPTVLPSGAVRKDFDYIGRLGRELARLKESTAPSRPTRSGGPEPALPPLRVELRPIEPPAPVSPVVRAYCSLCGFQVEHNERLGITFCHLHGLSTRLRILLPNQAVLP